ncbi:MAG: hypothetical protein WCF17_20440 [Terracidiphilus sp.]
MKWIPAAVLLVLLAGARSGLAQSAPSPTAEAIMARVAANQDRAVAERAHYVYVQHFTCPLTSGRPMRRKSLARLDGT